MSRPHAIEHLPRLLVFAHVAEHASFAKAAAALGMSRSTVSHHVQVLEEALGARLLERTSRSVRLTDAGRELARTASDVRAAWQLGVHRLSQHADEALGSLTVTAPDLVAERFVVPAVHAFREENPRCAVELRITGKNLDVVREVDVAVRSGPLPDSGLGARRLARTEHIIVGTPALAEAWAGRTPDALSDAPWVDYSERRPRRELTDGERRVVVHDSPQVRTDTASSLMSLLMAGAGIAMMARIFVMGPLAEGTLVDLCPGWRAAEPLTFHAVTPSPRPHTPKTRRFIHHLEHAFGVRSPEDPSNAED
ncbi:MAG: LysR substrate-binding domain-containing protein [Sandaracinaceae bacterium]